MESGDDLLSRAVASQVPSARRGLTSVFGMGTGGSLLPLSPEIVFSFQGSHPENHTGKADLELSALFAFSPLLRSSPRPISISKLQRYRSFTADLSPYRL